MITWFTVFVQFSLPVSIILHTLRKERGSQKQLIPQGLPHLSAGPHSLRRALRGNLLLDRTNFGRCSKYQAEIRCIQLTESVKNIKREYLYFGEVYIIRL